jgi:hypothetical protein
MSVALRKQFFSLSWPKGFRTLFMKKRNIIWDVTLYSTSSSEDYTATIIRVEE